ncbi:MAG: hypothetical protein ALECFALPRED_009611 [Alectoria fallacina]|uniref:Methyltransferase type 11 domain-containing protein n=1 Tax=Alectoria fallacina TaxID=1903189 RepID=A0A8H3IG33_9LECA|nr:MAG: hypothetical protein ALECFALPRED_009611 [Alectoria fallacina]
MAQTYNDRTGGCNITLANRLLALTAPSLPPPNTTRTLRILDNASGPMILTTQCLLDPTLTSHPAIHISAVDLSADFVAANRATLSSNPAFFCGNGRKVDTAVMDGLDLQFPDNTFDLSFTSLALFAFPDPVKGARELFRTLKPGGVAAATTWKSVGWLPLLHEVEAMLRPGRRPRTRMPALEPWSVPGKLARTLREAGFGRVEECEVECWAWWGGVGEAARWVAATVGMLVGEGWSQGGEGGDGGGVSGGDGEGDGGGEGVGGEGGGEWEGGGSDGGVCGGGVEVGWEED